MTIEQIKESLSIQDVLAHYGYAINRNKHINCPFHEDKNPSMKVYEETNTVYCFSGNCSTHGKSLDVIEFIMKHESCTRHQAIMKCKSLLNYQNPNQKKMNLIPQLWQEFTNCFTKSKKAKSYAQSRGIENLELGYNQGRWHNKKERTEDEIKAAQNMGYLLPSMSNKGHKVWAKECLIFALRNAKNEVVSFYGRSINQSGHFYIKNRQGLYPSYPKATTKKLILTESIIDAASLLQIASIVESYSVLALYGTNGLTEEHRAAISNLKNLEEIIIMLDGDEAGSQASEKLAKFLIDQLGHSARSCGNPNLSIKIAHLAKDMDVNELWANHLSEGLFLELLSEAQELKPSSNTALKIINANYYIYKTQKLNIEVLGGINIEQMDKMACTLRLTRIPKRNALDKLRQNLNLYHSGQVKSLIKRVAEEFELPMQELRLVFANLIESLEEVRSQEQDAALENQLSKRSLSKEQKQKALAFLEDEKLMERTWEDLGKIGIVGERISAMIMYLCFSSRKLEKPLHVISLGSSGSLKTHLQESIAELIPEHEVINITSLSDNALYYYPKGSLEHSLFVVEDMDGMSEDAQYAVRELKSKGYLKKDVVLKDVKGKPRTVSVFVKGPICFAGSTTKEKVYEDNANRCLLLYRNESKAHKEAVMKQQRKASAGRVNELEQRGIKELFKDVQMMLQPIKVVNPYAEKLVLPNQVFKPLRTNAHYLKFIEVITFYHQHQRTIKTSQSGTRYIETTIEDIEWANKLMKDVLLSKSDELSWGVRQFLERLKRWLEKNKVESFRMKEVREALRINPANMKYYVQQLLRYNQLKILGGSRYRGFEYELVKQNDYQELKSHIDSVLDTVLEQIKSR
ncbi:CHC2 zinc finger domain-containing protein [Aureispira sp. CCB-QB1]|uniref:CHC2 zinc finger domain-containing protein n=1 Tax=Aureispira sp. CCB-QB1 TaxID=1313421 RepID=UPI0006962229|nr:CHC2 zinc finger domain-containing protein [Aureispira sp. CCB-QB1]